MVNKFRIQKMADVVCPYCEEEFEVCQDDGRHCDQDAFEPEECDHCHKEMMIRTSWTVDHRVVKADCLNGGDEGHIWREYTDGAILFGHYVERQGQKCRACDKIKWDVY